MKYVRDDGGRAAAGYKGDAGDCVCRAIVIASGRPYKEVYQHLAAMTGAQRRSKRTRKRAASARNGVNTKRKWFRDYMRELGFTWIPTMHIGSGCTTHLADGEIPMKGRLVVCVSGHYTAVIDGVIHDTYEPSREGNRCVYGYWTRERQEKQRERHLAWKQRDQLEWVSVPFGYYVQEEPSPLGTFFALKHQNKHLGGANTLGRAKAMAERHYLTGSL